MPQSGYIYILINPTLNGLVKIGKTSKTSEERAKELSSATGVPTQFMVAYDEFFEDIDSAENHVHEVLKNMGHHVFPNKEFFDIPLKEAIGVINETRKYFSTILNSNTESDEILGEDDSIEPPYQSILNEAFYYRYGIDDYIQDYYEAFSMYETAYKLGSGEACLELGDCYFKGEGCSKNDRTALDYLKEGVKRGNLNCYLLMSEIYTELNEQFNAEKCVAKLFYSLEKKDVETRPSIVDRLNYQVEKESLIKQYLNTQFENGKEVKYLDQIKGFKKELISNYQSEKFGNIRHKNILEFLENL